MYNIFFFRNNITRKTLPRPLRLWKQDVSRLKRHPRSTPFHIPPCWSTSKVAASWVPWVDPSGYWMTRKNKLYVRIAFTCLNMGSAWHGDIWSHLWVQCLQKLNDRWVINCWAGDYIMILFYEMFIWEFCMCMLIICQFCIFCINFVCINLPASIPSTWWTIQTRCILYIHVLSFSLEHHHAFGVGCSPAATWSVLQTTKSNGASENSLQQWGSCKGLHCHAANSQGDPWTCRQTWMHLQYGWDGGGQNSRRQGQGDCSERGE